MIFYVQSDLFLVVFTLYLLFIKPFIKPSSSVFFFLVLLLGKKFCVFLRENINHNNTFGQYDCTYLLPWSNIAYLVHFLDTCFLLFLLQSFGMLRVAPRVRISPATTILMVLAPLLTHCDHQNASNYLSVTHPSSFHLC